MVCLDRLGWPGDDLLSRALRQSTIGAEVFDGRVRDGIGSGHFAESHQAGETVNGSVGARTGPGVSPRIFGGMKQTGLDVWPRLMGGAGSGLVVRL